MAAASPPNGAAGQIPPAPPGRGALEPARSRQTPEQIHASRVGWGVVMGHDAYLHSEKIRADEGRPSRPPRAVRSGRVPTNQAREGKT